MPSCVEPPACPLAGGEETAGQDEPEPGVGGAGGVLQGEDQPRPPHPTRGGAAEQGQRGEGEAEECGPQLKVLEAGRGGAPKRRIGRKAVFLRTEGGSSLLSKIVADGGQPEVQMVQKTADEWR